MTTLHTIHSLVRPWFSITPAMLALAMAVTACGAHDEPPPPPFDADESTSDPQDVDVDDDDDDRPTRSRCEEGDARECRIKLPKQGSVQNCIDGVRYCENGVWGPCETD